MTLSSVEPHIKKISAELSLSPHQVSATVGLLDDECSIPFISRYRKEVTGSLDEVAVTSIRDRLHQLRELDKRRGVVLESIHTQGKLTDDLKGKILAAESMSVLEDLYLPYKPKRRTRATVAKEKGLEPLARKIFEQSDFDVNREAMAYVSGGQTSCPDEGKNPNPQALNAEDALAGARDIIAEWINEDALACAKMRGLYFSQGTFQTKVIKGKEQEGVKFRDYYDWQESVGKAPSHRVLAMRRGEKEGILTLKVTVPESEALQILEGLFIKARNSAAQQVRMAIADCFTRLLSLSMETEVRVETKKQADTTAVAVFSENLRQLLMAAPLGQRNVLAMDPGFRTGCKVVCLDRQGKLLYNDTIFPTGSERQAEEAAETVKKLCRKFEVEFIAIGNGTASRETESFVRGLQLPKDIQVIVVSESGASVYSASDVAREEFPGHDVTVRGAVSIGRRLMDPLAELVKIDPKSIGVGQYQHDVDQVQLKKGLDDVVVSCVNQVGVELNTASKELLMYVSGLGPVLAKTIVEFRNAHGPFHSREQIREVPRMGPKIFEQAAGFLRIRDGQSPLDASAVHPECYGVVEMMARDMNCSVSELIRDQNLQRQIDFPKYVNDRVGLPTLMDIKQELAKPGRDPRKKFEVFKFDESVQKMEDLKIGMKLPGIVTNIAAFGVFVDIGVHQDGLVHVSELADRYVKDPGEIVKVHQHVKVTVLEIDLARKRIALSLKAQPGGKSPKDKAERWGPKLNAPKPFVNNPFKSMG